MHRSTKSWPPIADHEHRRAAIESLTGILMCGRSTGFSFAVVSGMFEGKRGSMDPLFVASEGRLVAMVATSSAERMLRAMREVPQGGMRV